MLNQYDTTDKIQMVTGSAGSVDYHVSYIDNNAGTITGNNSYGNVTTAATTDISPAPAASVLRNAKTINIRNKHASNSNLITINFVDGTLTIELFKVTLAAGESLTYTEGIGWNYYAADGSFKTASSRLLFKCLTADDTGGQNVATAQPWFPTAGGVTLLAATTYFFEGLLHLTRAAGAVSHTTGLLFGGTATLTSIDYLASARSGDVNTAPGANSVDQVISVATNTQIKAASTSTTEDILVKVLGVVRINAGGTFIPQFIYSAAPGGAPTIKRNSFFMLWPIGDNNIASVGTWA
jgi:hypothetical protein